MNYKINKYPDGTSYVTIEERPVYDIVDLTFRINSYGDLIHLSQLCEVLEYNHVRANILIPNLLDAQADRRFNMLESSGLRVVAEIMNLYEDIHFEIFHPHNSEATEAYINNITIVDNSNFIEQVLPRIIKPLGNELILMSSDAGGFKPLMKLCDKIGWKGETYSASKARKYEDGKSSLSQFVDRQDFGGKDVLIIDDISVYGGTFKGLSILLKERNIGKLYLAVSHMTMQNLGDDPVTNYFDKVFTTNSKFDSYYGKYAEGSDRTVQPKNLEIIKLF